ncbi:MAG: DbpA RNA binding domain-containing protein [Gammaproteobacteria bacterium]
MDITKHMPTARPNPVQDAVKIRLQHILNKENLDNQRALTKILVNELDVDFLDFSAALLCLYQQHSLPDEHARRSPPPSGGIPQPAIRMVRYRLEVGNKHQVTRELLIKILVEESGVDKKNIHNIDIQNACTFIELPDEMPHDIFLHLKAVEVNRQKLDIKRVKKHSPRKKSHHRARRGFSKKTDASREA